MTILITGSSSYIGKNLIEEFKKRKIKYLGLDLNITKNKNCIKLDILKKKQLKLLKKKFSLIIHLAAVSNENDAKKKPTKCFEVNFLGTLNIINFAIEKKIPKILFASTEWVYDFSGYKNNHVNRKLNFFSMKNFYASSKFLGEQLIKNQSLVKYCILRFGIIYGKRKKKFSAVETIVKNLKNNSHIVIGSKKTMRRFIHIDDVVSAIVKSIKFKNNCLADIQGPEKITLGYLIFLLSKILKKDIKVVENNKKKPSIRNVVISKKIDKLEWRPRIRIKDGLLNIVK
jgi:nucleoside-diphosphate-sugar epimerase